ncbi:MAG: dipeptide epimerase [Bradyrhizobiaceae bacterium]|nr:dipeptide epimerase [Bradyrhizobiaceae bacterium]
MPIRLSVTAERWPIAGSFTISRGAKTEAEVVVATLADGEHVGRGECVPYARYGETVDGVIAAIARLAPAVANGLDRNDLAASLPAGAARNALDCAFWDLAAKRSGTPAHVLAGLPQPNPLVTAYTISLAAPEIMADAAAAAAARPLLKVKLGGPGDPARIAAVRTAAPDSALIVDANEGWTAANLMDNLAACAEAGVRLIEQPLPARDDAALASCPHAVPICADESVHDRASLAGLRGRYDAVNIKLDKTGGLTEALAVAAAARSLGFDLMVGCMVSTSLAIAPALLVAQGARYVDLDGPLLLARDRPDGLRFDGSIVHPASPALWG